MRSLILLMILGFIGTKTVQSKCVEGEPCATGEPLTDDRGTPLVRGIPSLGFTNASSPIHRSNLQHGTISCGILTTCRDTQTCCYYSFCCEGTSSTCCPGQGCCPENTRCCGSGSVQWCCRKRDGCSWIDNMCTIGGRAAVTQSTSVASLLLPALMAMAFLV